MCLFLVLLFLLFFLESSFLELHKSLPLTLFNTDMNVMFSVSCRKIPNSSYSPGISGG